MASVGATAVPVPIPASAAAPSCPERDAVLRDLRRLSSAAAEFTAMPTFQTHSKDYARFKSLRGSIIAIEGIIGAGKTTLGGALASYLNNIGIKATFLEEKTIKNLMDLFYDALDKKLHPNPYAYAVQDDMIRQCQIVYLMAKRLAEVENQVVIVDRTVFGNAVFEMMHHVNGNINQKEHQAYMEIMGQFAPYKYDYIVYLDINPKRALELIKLRAKKEQRKNERNMTIEYLYDLERAYYIQLVEQIRARHANILVLQNDIFYDEADSVLDKLVAYAPRTQPGSDCGLDLSKVLSTDGMLEHTSLRDAFHYLRSWTSSLCGENGSNGSSRSGTPTPNPSSSSVSGSVMRTSSSDT